MPEKTVNVPLDKQLHSECEVKAWKALDMNLIDYTDVRSYTDHLYKERGGEYAK